MKKLLLLTLVILLCGCQRPIDKYKGAIILEKKGVTAVGFKVAIQKGFGDEACTFDVFVYEYDYNRYNVGDTIK